MNLRLEAVITLLLRIMKRDREKEEVTYVEREHRIIRVLNNIYRRGSPIIWADLYNTTTLLIN